MSNLSRRSAIILASCWVTAGRAQGLTSENRVALRGYDPVAYFTQGRPLKGSADFVAEYDGSVYLFSTAGHRDLFASDPERYAPQFNGMCAITLSRGAIYDPDPEAWVIADGKLYLFGSKSGVPAFHQQKASIVAKAGENWSRLKPQLH